jgi:type IV pilus assembly protein PilN
MRITLNLATRPFTDLGPAIRRLRIAMAVLAVVSLAFLFGLHEIHEKAEQARAREHSLDGAIAAINNERQGYTVMMQRPDNAQFIAEVVDLNQLFDEKSFSWTLAMENLETVLPAGVQVTQIEPVRAKNGQITLHLRVVGPHDRSIELVRNLEHSARFVSPRIVGENAESSGNGPNQRLEPVSASNRFEFDILADYNPPAPGERAFSRRASAAAAAESRDTDRQRGTNQSAGSHRVSSFNAGREPYTGNAASPQPGAVPPGYAHPAPGGPQ